MGVDNTTAAVEIERKSISARERYRGVRVGMEFR